MQNFGRIKHAFNEILVESIGKKNSPAKELFKKYVKTIKESEILKTQFFVYNNIEKRVDNNDLSATYFIQENLSLLKKYKVSDIIKENKKLLALSNDVSIKLNESYDISSVHDSLTNLITTTKTPTNIDSLANDTKCIVEFIKTNKGVEITEGVNTDIPPSMFATLVVDKFNEKYDSLDESDKDILKAIVGSTNLEKKEIYENTVRDCISLINEKLTVADLDTKDKLLMVKDKLLNDKQSVGDVDFISEIAKLASLKDTLIND